MKGQMMVKDKLPPHNLDVETSLLGSLIHSKESRDRTIDKVKVNDFYIDKHRLIFKAIRDKHREDDLIDVPMLAAELGRRGVLEKVGDKFYLVQLLNDCPNPDAAETYAETLIDLARRRELADGADRLRTAVMLGEDPQPELEALEKIQERGAGEDKRLKGYTVKDLRAMDLTPPTSVVEGLIFNATLTGLAGKPFSGKSKIATDITLCVATGNPALGSLPVEKGRATYVSLEDGPARIMDRIDRFLDSTGISDEELDDVSFYFNWRPLDQGGQTNVERLLWKEADHKLLIIDTLAGIKPRQSRTGNIYEHDYAALAPLQKLANESNTAIMVLHHFRKAESDDPLDLVSGSTGWTAAVDAVLLLKPDQGRADATLSLISRDIENTEYALGFDKPSGTWIVLGPAEEYRRSENRQAVINTLEEAGEPVGPAYIAEALDMNPNTAKVLMRRMFADGDIRQEGRGLYVPCNP